MKTYTHSTGMIPLSFPPDWDPSSLTALTLTIADRDGNTLQTATPASLYTPATLGVDAYRYDYSVTLASGAADLLIGDQVRITGVNGYEDHTVKGYAPVTRMVTLEAFVDRDFEMGATLLRLSGTATVDFSNTTTYPAGIQLLLTWTPTGTGSPLTVLAEIESTDSLDIAGFEAEFQAFYPRAWDALHKPEDRFDKLLKIAKERLYTALRIRGVDVARIKDQRVLSYPLMLLLAEVWTANGDEDLADERAWISKAYSAAIEELYQSTIWVDADNDNVEEDEETQDHPSVFYKVW